LANKNPVRDLCFKESQKPGGGGGGGGGVSVCLVSDALRMEPIVLSAEPAI
jgi:hypothetical protein